MHIILEGSLELCTRHLLIQLIQRHLHWIFLIIEYNPSNTDNLKRKTNPPFLLPKHIANDGHLKQSDNYTTYRIKYTAKLLRKLCKMTIHGENFHGCTIVLLLSCLEEKTVYVEDNEFVAKSVVHGHHA